MLFRSGTVEFRLFQFDEPGDGRRGGLHAGQLKSYIQLCLALSQMAKEVKTASPKPQQNENPKYAMRTWLLRLGFIGDVVKSASSRIFQVGAGLFHRAEQIHHPLRLLILLNKIFAAALPASTGKQTQDQDASGVGVPGQGRQELPGLGVVRAHLDRKSVV